MKSNKKISQNKVINNLENFYNKIKNNLEKIKIDNNYVFKNNYIILIFMIIIAVFLIIYILLFLFNSINKIETYENLFEPTSNTVHNLSNVFKNPELNLQSYNNVKIDPGESLLQKNKFLPECCFYNSEYSTSKGCACITPQQQDYLRSRGSNKSKSSFIQESTDYKNLYFSPTMTYKGDNMPFQKHQDKYILDYKPLTSEKINEFNNLINLSSYGEKNKITEKINKNFEKFYIPNTLSFSLYDNGKNNVVKNSAISKTTNFKAI